MRFLGKAKMGFYPLPVVEAERIRALLRFPDTSCAALDPCVGDGVAFAAVTSGAAVLRYGIELDSYRAEQARERVPNTLQGNALETHCPVESCSLLYLNPPYDRELGSGQNQRMEQVFLSHTYRWLKPGGVLILVTPRERLVECSTVLATHFREARVYELTEPLCVSYHQIALMAIRSTRRERERLQDSDITRARLGYSALAKADRPLPTLESEQGVLYPVPESGPLALAYRGLPLDEIEDLLPRSPAYRQAGRLLFALEPSPVGRPLTPLHAGHTALLAVSGLLNGIFGSDENRHIATWCSVKVIDKTTEEDEEGVITIREKERFSNELTLVYATGRVATLK
jgi:16S rRNA G966 N2-methylase RsmD